MDIEKILTNKQIKAKAKTETISKMLAEKNININELMKIAQSSKDPIKAICIEAIEFATKSKPEIASLDCLEFISKSLTEKAPRVKWESAKVIGNIAHLYPDKLNDAINNLLYNSEHEGTVVRWSAAFALGQIIKMNTSLNIELIPAIESICKREEQNSIRKIYLDALKKVTT